MAELKLRTGKCPGGHVQTSDITGDAMNTRAKMQNKPDAYLFARHQA